jgi:hypothetical protein
MWAMFMNILVIYDFFSGPGKIKQRLFFAVFVVACLVLFIWQQPGRNYFFSPQGLDQTFLYFEQS